MEKGYFIAQKLANGTPGRPVGSEEDSGIMLFEDLNQARAVRDNMSLEHGALSIFVVNLGMVGEVIL
jgi:hypothetical protein